MHRISPMHKLVGCQVQQTYILCILEMKKILVVCAAMMLHCLLVHAQEADNNGITLNVVPRLDANYNINTQKGVDNEHSWGNTSLYTLFEGNLSESFSFSIANHWYQHKPKPLYKNFLRSDNVNWVDWLNLSYNIKDFTITGGKVAMLVGGFEFDDYDWETHPVLNSSLWDSFVIYQWGGNIQWQISEDHAITGQMTCSPYGRRPLKSGLMNWGLNWHGTFGDWETNTSFTLVQHTKLGKGTSFFKCYEKLLTVGIRGNFEPAVVTLDIFNKVGNEEEIMVNGITLAPSVTVNINEKLDVFGKGVIEHSKDEVPGFKQDVVKVGGGAHWRPLKNDQNLRVHALVGYDSTFKSVILSAGVLYNFNIKVR